MILVDTSAWYALLDEDDDNHTSAVRRWRALLTDSALLTHAYVVVETSAIMQRRLGMTAVERLHRDLLPVVQTVMIDTTTHQRAVDRWRTANRRGISLVDVTSFVVMSDRHIDTAFAYDEDFLDSGFQLYTEHESKSGTDPGGDEDPSSENSGPLGSA